jgi:hypothetical protein
MGTGFGVSGAIADPGIIPRAVEHIFSSIAQATSADDNSRPAPIFEVKVQFIEVQP